MRLKRFKREFISSVAGYDDDGVSSTTSTVGSGGQILRSSRCYPQSLFYISIYYGGGFLSTGFRTTGFIPGGGFNLAGCGLFRGGGGRPGSWPRHPHKQDTRVW